MYLIRQAKVGDVPTLLKLARMVHFVNLPADREVIHAKVMRSRDCFRRLAGGRQETEPGPVEEALTGLATMMRSTDFFMFVLEDTGTGACVGTSQLIARMGGPGNPTYAFKLEKREFFSETLQTGTTHTVARLHADESGPTEVGGLILQPAARGHRLGRFLSFIRFHFIGLHRRLFADRVVAEMMAPVSLDGQNLLWEYLGRRFIPLSYTEADKHCQRSREFIEALLPKTDLYLSLLPPEARDVVGRVGEETVPARKMLERLGFRFRGRIDPFDGGPHLEARTDDIPLVRQTRQMVLGPALSGTGGRGGRSPAEAEPDAPLDARYPLRAMISRLDPNGEFRAVDVSCTMTRTSVSIPRAVMQALQWEAGMEVGVTVLERRRASSPDAEEAPARGEEIVPEPAPPAEAREESTSPRRSAAPRRRVKS